MAVLLTRQIQSSGPSCNAQKPNRTRQQRLAVLNTESTLPDSRRFHDVYVHQITMCRALMLRLPANSRGLPHLRRLDEPLPATGSRQTTLQHSTTQAAGRTVGTATHGAPSA